MQPEVDEQYVRFFVHNLLCQDPPEQAPPDEDVEKSSEQMRDAYEHKLVHAVFQVCYITAWVAGFADICCCKWMLLTLSWGLT